MVGAISAGLSIVVDFGRRDRKTKQLRIEFHSISVSESVDSATLSACKGRTELVFEESWLWGSTFIKL